PLEVSRAEYFGNPATALGRLAAAEPRAKAGLRIRLKCGAGMPFNALALDRLPLFLSGADEQPFRLYEQLLGNACALFIKSTN
ncbi:type VI secretion system baseplate subunit TssF, partial [Escherichia coli]|uniref:type VI secretion system baseplate subunit TssF n=1 Tax=Escherichia coli TaxID=562 RepID=UPI0028DFE7D9